MINFHNKKTKYGIIAMVLFLVTISAISNVYYKKTSKKVVDNSRLTGYFSAGATYPDRCTTDTEMDLGAEFGLDNMGLSDSQKANAESKIRDKINQLKKKAKGTEGNNLPDCLDWMCRSGETQTFVSIGSAGQVSFLDRNVGLNGNASFSNLKPLVNFLNKNSGNNIVPIHTHDSDTSKFNGMVCEDDPIDEENGSQCNPDSPPSVNDMVGFNGQKELLGTQNAFIVEHDGDVWKYSVKPGSPMSQLTVDNFLDSAIAKRAIELEKARQAATTKCEANKATKEYSDYMKSQGAVFSKVED